MKDSNKIVILGAGLSGLTLASYLKRNNFEIYEKESTAGGICRTIKKNGFIFDYTGHWLSFKNNSSINILTGILKDNLQLIKRRGWIFLNGSYIRQPIQNYLYDLPTRLRFVCLLDFIRERLNNAKSKDNNKKHIDMYFRKTFGHTLSRYFFIPYNKKLWKKYYDGIVAGCLRKYIEKVKIQAVIEGTFLEDERHIGYNAKFYYPKEGGIEEITKNILNELLNRNKNVSTSYEAAKIDIERKTILFSNGFEKKYDVLISTMPLPFLLRIIQGLPEPIRQAGGKLKYISLLVYNLGINKLIFPGKHWIFYPERKYIFHKIGFPSNISSHLSPVGTTSMYVYVSISKNSNTMNADFLTKRIKHDLKTIGILRRNTNILVEAKKIIEPAYVVIDDYYHKVLKEIKHFLFRKGIVLTGRFGAWRYSNLEKDMLDVMNIARWINSNDRNKPKI